MITQDLKEGKLGEMVEQLLPKNTDNTGTQPLFPPNGSEVGISENELGSMSTDVVDMMIFDGDKKAIIQERCINEIEMLNFDRV
jgi:hypothetical protein